MANLVSALVRARAVTKGTLYSVSRSKVNKFCQVESYITQMAYGLFLKIRKYTMNKTAHVSQW